MTERDCILMFTLLAASYPNHVVTDAQMSIYSTMLSPYDARQVERAVLQHIQTSQWYPTISDLLQQIAALDVPDADQAWSEVRRKVWSVGQYQVPQWSNTAVAETVASIGWTELCQSENPEALRAHFFKLYGVIASRTVKKNLVTALPAKIRDGLGLIGSNAIGRRSNV